MHFSRMLTYEPNDLPLVCGGVSIYFLELVSDHSNSDQLKI